MKKEELEKIFKNLDEIKSITDRQEYVVSKGVNQLMNEVKPILNAELERMDSNGVECIAPQIQCFTSSSLEGITELLNTNLEQLVKADYKVIDYSVELHNTITKPNTYTILYLGTIKYTS